MRYSAATRFCVLIRQPPKAAFSETWFAVLPKRNSQRVLYDDGDDDDDTTEHGGTSPLKPLVAWLEGAAKVIVSRGLRACVCERLSAQRPPPFSRHPTLSGVITFHALLAMLCLGLDLLALAPFAAASTLGATPLLRPPRMLLEFLVDRDQLVLFHSIRLPCHGGGRGERGEGVTGLRGCYWCRRRVGYPANLGCTTGCSGSTSLYVNDK